MIAVIDYAAGNLRSVKRALDFLKIENQVTNDPAEVAKADAVIIPGVGAAGAAMANLEKNGLVEALQNFIKSGKPYLGICLGLQILFDVSKEDNSKCLGVFPGLVEKMNSSGVKIPHIGWNPVEFPSTDSGQVNAPEIMKNIESGTQFYFVHSFIAKPEDDSIVKATATHGETFPAVIQKDNVWGVQFHPEKSGKVGLQVLQNFAKLI